MSLLLQITAELLDGVVLPAGAVAQPTGEAGWDAAAEAGGGVAGDEAGDEAGDGAGCVGDRGEPPPWSTWPPTIPPNATRYELAQIEKLAWEVEVASHAFADDYREWGWITFDDLMEWRKFVHKMSGVPESPRQVFVI